MQIAPRLVEEGEAPMQRVVLIMAANDLMRQMLGEIVRRAGLRRLEVCDMQQGIALFRQHAAEISCVLLDLDEPLHAWAEVFFLLRAERRDLPIVFLNDCVCDLSAATRQDPLAIELRKPFEVRALRAALAALLGPDAPAAAPARPSRSPC